MNLGRLIDSIKSSEGYVAQPYQDHLGYWTVGYGHLIEHEQLNEFVSAQHELIDSLGDLLTVLSNELLHKRWLNEDIAEAIQSAQMFCGDSWDEITDEQREVVSEMAFQLGRSRLFLFRRFQEALKSGQTELAIKEMLDSKWARQTPSRAARLAAHYTK